MDRYDVIVIGAGMAGLTCAAKLARAGKKVLLLEQHRQVGGYCTNFKRKGFEFDAAIHFIAGCEPGGILGNLLLDCGAENDVEFIKLAPTVYKAMFPGITLEIPPTVDEMTDLIAKHFPHEAKNFRKFLKGMERIFDFVNPYSDPSVPAWKKALAPALSPRGLAFFLRHANMTLAQYLDRHLSDRRVREIGTQLWGFLGVPPAKLSLIFFVMAFMAYYKQGAYYIKGGSQKLSDGLCAAFKRNGGEVLVNADVKEILIRDNRATGVRVELKRTRETREFFSDQVVSCADASHTYLDLVGEHRLPPAFVKKMKGLAPSLSAFCVYLGVDMELPEEFRDDFDVFINYTWDSEAGFDKLVRREGFDALALGFYSNVEPEFSPTPGKKHVITLVTLMNLSEGRMKEIWGTEDVQKRGSVYRRIKQEIADELIDMAEKHLPGLRDSIEVMSIATPVTMKRYTRNLNGALVGWENNVAQSLLNRMQQRSPVKNLTLASAWTFPGGGVNGATSGGAMAADRILKGRTFSRIPLKGLWDSFLDLTEVYL